MATWYVAATGGNDSNSGEISAPKATITAGLQPASDGDTISIANGTYTENITVSGTLTIKSTTGDKEDVIITSSGAGKTITIATGSFKTVIQDLTIKYTSTQNSTTSNAGAIVASSNGTGERLTIQRCQIESNTCGVGYFGPGTTIDRCRLVGTGVAGNATKAKGSNYGIVAFNNTVTVTACLLEDWGAAGMYIDHNDAVVKNCTVVATGDYDTYFQGAIWSLGDASGGPTIANCIAFNGHGTDNAGMRIGFQNSSNSHAGIHRNNLAFDLGANRDMGDNSGTSASSAKQEYFRLDGATTTNLYGGDYDGNGSADNSYADHAVSSEDIFEDQANGIYHLNANGSAAGNGLADLAASFDYSGSAFSATPSIGCFETSGWSAGSNVAGTALASIASVKGVAKASISKINGL